MNLTSTTTTAPKVSLHVYSIQLVTFFKVNACLMTGLVTLTLKHSLIFALLATTRLKLVYFNCFTVIGGERAETEEGD